jgi:hypothetical protein
MIRLWLRQTRVVSVDWARSYPRDVAFLALVALVAMITFAALIVRGVA